MSRCAPLVALCVALLVSVAPGAAHASSAALDPSFGAGGETILTLNGGWHGAGDAVRTPDDRIVVAGIEQDYGLAIARLTQQGAPDPSFDGDGITTLALPGLAGDYAEVTGVAVDAANNVYVAAKVPGNTGALFKFDAGGAEVSAFAGGVPLLFGATPGGVRLSPDGSRVYVSAGSGPELQVHALSPADGAYVSAFGGGDGVAEISLPHAVFVDDIVVRPLDGKILVGGGVVDPDVGVGLATMFVARFTATGGVDSFGSGGVARPFKGFSAQESEAFDLFALADGTTYAVGWGDGSQSLAIARLTDSGARDPGFNGSGLLTDYAAGTGNRWDGVNVQQDGAITVTGGRQTSQGAFALTRRYTASGALDTSFADGGTYTRAHTYPARALVAQTSGAGRYVSMAFDPDPLNPVKSRLVLTGIRPTLSSSPPPATQDPPASPPSTTPAPTTTTTPEKPVAAGCTRSIVLGPLEITGECLKREGMVWKTSAAATVGGLKFVPNGASSELVIDPLNLRVAARGGAKVTAGAAFFGRQLGPVTLYEGSFDWTFQYRPDLSGLARLVMPQPGAGGQQIAQSTWQGLPGLAGVGALPRLPDLGFPDFSKLKSPDVSKLAGKIPSLHTPNVQIPLSLLDIRSLPELRFQVPRSAGSVFGFPVQGDVALKMAERGGVRGVDTSLNLGLPAVFGGLTGASRFFVGVNGQVIVDAIGIDAKEVGIPGGIRIAPVKLAYDGPKNTWEGDTRVYLGFQQSDTGLGARWLIENGQLRRIGVSAGGIPLGGVATIDDLVADLTMPPTRVYGTVRVGAGPTVPVLKSRIVRIGGTFDFNGDFAKLTGDVALANVPLANASAEYWWNGYFSAKGRIAYFIDGKNEYGFEGTVAGEASKKGFNAEGSVQFKAKDKSFSGKGLVSSVGVAGCASIKGVLWTNINLGAGYKWGAKWIDWIGGSCDFGPYRANLRAVAAQAGAPVGVSVRGEQRAVAFKVLGDGTAPPRFTLTGPGGVTVTTPEDGSTVIDDRFVIIQQPGENVTYVAVAKPKAGSWTFTAAPGSVVRSVSGADALPEPEVRATLKRGVLRYTVTPIAGQKVRFLELGRGAGIELGVASGARGALNVQPGAGPSGPRRIVAVVEQNGMVRERITVARYRATARPLAAPVVRVTRSKTGVAKVRWTPVAGATGYQVIVKLNGRGEQQTVGAKQRSVNVAGVLSASGVVATVRAVGGPTRIGKAGRSDVAKPKVRKRTGKVPKKPTKKSRR
ncbi:MAG: hypothetical protein JHC95_05110 [Solirubrobacteraceae bacterium]|nr:hypothetical protein [Solirubrobacteraceae bacterium]